MDDLEQTILSCGAGHGGPRSRTALPRSPRGSCQTRLAILSLSLLALVSPPRLLPAQPAEARTEELDSFVAELLTAPDEAAWRDLLGDSPDRVTSELAVFLLDRAMGLAGRGEFGRALTATAIARHIAARLEDRVLEAYCAQRAAVIHYRRQDFAEAVAQAKKALAILDGFVDPDPTVTQAIGAVARVTLAHAFHGLCRYDAAVEQFERVRSSAQANDRPFREADALVGIGNVRHATGQYGLAMQAYSQALQIYREEWSPWVGGPESVDRMVRAVSASASAPGLAHPMAACYNNIGLLKHEQGQHKEALDYLRPALNIHALVQDRPEQARTLNNAGSVYLALGQDGQAQSSFEDALEIAEDLELPAEAARAWINLGNIDASHGRLDDAHRRFAKAADFLEAVGDRSGRAAALNNAACLLARQGRYSEALLRYQQVLDIAREISARGAEAVALNNIGHVRLWQARLAQDPKALDKAWFSFSQARRKAAKMGDRETLWRAAWGQGQTLEAAGDRASGRRQAERWQAAREAYEVSIEAIESMRFRLRETEFAEAFLGVDDKYRVYEDLVGLLGKRGRPAGALQYLQRARYAALTERLRLSAVETGDEALNALLDRYEELMGQREEIRRRLAQELARPEAQRSMERVANLRELRRASDAAVNRAWTALNQAAPEISTLARVNPMLWVTRPELLPAGAVLVQYLPAESQLLIFTTRKGGRPRLVAWDIGRAELNARIERVRELLQEADVPPPADGVPLDRDLRDLLVRLHADLIAPIEADLEGTELLVVVPYGMVFYLPFAALARETGPDEVTFLIEETPIAYLDEWTVHGLGPGTRPTFEGPSILVAFGNPDGSLPSADREVKNIAGLLPKARRQVYLGQDATRAAALDLPQPTAVVHFATHGMLNRQDLNETYLVLADGHLRQGEIYGLGLGARGTDLAVLSACQTFPGQEQPGVEVMGLANAFLRSGARPLLASLWAVHTESTAELMGGFYEPLVEDDGVGKAEALRRAQLVLLRNPRYAHPYFWSPFVLYGDWR